MAALQRFAKWILDLELWVVLALVAITAALPQLLPAAIVVAAMFWPVRWFATERFWLRTPVDWPILLIALIVPLNIWASADLTVSLPHIGRLILGILSVYAIIHWAKNWWRVNIVVLLLILAGVALALGTPLLIGDQIDQVNGPLRTLINATPNLIAEGVNSNIMAGALLILTPLPFAILLFDYRNLTLIKRYLLLASGVILVGMLGLLTSRGALLGMVTAFGGLLLLRWHKLVWALPFVLIATGVAFVLAGPDLVLEQLTAGGSSVTGLESRLEIWSRAFFMLEDVPYTGVGMGMYGKFADAIYPFFLVGGGQVSHAHNLFLQVGVDLGIPGLIGWLATLFIVLESSWQLYRHGNSSGRTLETGLGAGLLMSQIGLLVHGLVDAPIWVSRVAVVLWLVWGVAVAAWMVVAQTKNATST